MSISKISKRFLAVALSAVVGLGSGTVLAQSTLADPSIQYQHGPDVDIKGDWVSGKQYKREGDYHSTIEVVLGENPLYITDPSEYSDEVLLEIVGKHFENGSAAERVFAEMLAECEYGVTYKGTVQPLATAQYESLLGMFAERDKIAANRLGGPTSGDAVAIANWMKLVQMAMEKATDTTKMGCVTPRDVVQAVATPAPAGIEPVPAPTDG